MPWERLEGTPPSDSQTWFFQGQSSLRRCQAWAARQQEALATQADVKQHQHVCLRTRSGGSGWGEEPARPDPRADEQRVLGA